MEAAKSSIPSVDSSSAESVGSGSAAAPPAVVAAAGTSSSAATSGGSGSSIFGAGGLEHEPDERFFLSGVCKFPFLAREEAAEWKRRLGGEFAVPPDSTPDSPFLRAGYNLNTTAAGKAFLYERISSLFPLINRVYYGRDVDWDLFHAFLITYDGISNIKLAVHRDDSDITVNVCLDGDHYEDNEVVFVGGMPTPATRRFAHRLDTRSEIPVKAATGDAVIHYGHQVHYTRPIKAGVRWSIIIWLREKKLAADGTTVEAPTPTPSPIAPRLPAYPEAEAPAATDAAGPAATEARAP